MWWMILAAWILGWIIFGVFVRRFIENELCEGSERCKDCYRRVPCMWRIQGLAIFLWPLGILYTIFMLLILPIAQEVLPVMDRFHDWQLDVIERIRDRSYHKRIDKKEKRKEEEAEGIKALKIENKSLRRKIKKLNKFNREDIIDL